MDSISAIRFILALAGLVLYIVVWTVGLVGSYTIYTRYSRLCRRQSSSPSLSLRDLGGVSILRPLKGLDPQLEECLDSAFRQDYPQFEILLSVADEQDPAIKVARTLIAKYPNIPARLIIGIPLINPNSRSRS
jgi:ceramide glucosyltransferase